MATEELDTKDRSSNWAAYRKARLSPAQREALEHHKPHPCEPKLRIFTSTFTGFGDLMECIWNKPLNTDDAGKMNSSSKASSKQL